MAGWGAEEGSRAQSTHKKTMGYSNPAKGRRSALQALGLLSQVISQVSPEPICLGTNDPEHPTFQGRSSRDTPERIEGSGKPSVASPSLSLISRAQVLSWARRLQPLANATIAAPPSVLRVRSVPGTDLKKKRWWLGQSLTETRNTKVLPLRLPRASGSRRSWSP